MIHPKRRVPYWMFSRFPLVLIALIFSNCQSSSKKTFLYPSKEESEIRMICRQAYTGSEARHQSWEKSPVSWLFISVDHITVYFENDRTRTLPKNLIQTLKPGKYPCLH